MIKLTHILEEILSSRLGYLFEDDAPSGTEKPKRKKKPAASAPVEKPASEPKPKRKTKASEPVVEPVAEPSEEPTEPTAGASDSLKAAWKKYNDDKKKQEKEEFEKTYGKIPPEIKFHYPPTPEQRKRGEREGRRFPPGTIKPKKLNRQERTPSPRSSMTIKSPEEIAAQSKKKDDKTGQTPDAPKSVADELQDYFRSMLNKADDKDAENNKKMQAILARQKEKLASKNQEKIDAAKAEYDKWLADKEQRRADALAKRTAAQAAGKVRIKTGNITDPDSELRSKKNYITDPKTGLLVLPDEEPTNLDIRQFDPKAIDAVSAAYQKFLRYNPPASEAENYLRLLLKKNKLPPQLGTPKYSKKFSGD